MDTGPILKRMTSGRRIRPGSMIATRMQVFEAVERQTDVGMRHEHKPLSKAKSMMDLTLGVGGRGLSGHGQTTPTLAGEEREALEGGGVVCNPSTGQAVPLPRVMSSPQSHTHKPHLPTPPHVSSTSDYTCGFQVGHNDPLEPPDHGPPHDYDPPEPPYHGPPQTSPTTGASPARGGVGNLKQLFEVPRRTSLSRATSLPFLTPSPQSHGHTPPHPPPQDWYNKVGMSPKLAQPVGGTCSKASTLPNASCLKTSQTSQTSRSGGQGKKIPLLPPPTKHVRIIEPQDMSNRQLPQQLRNCDHSNKLTAVPQRRKIPLLPPTISHPHSSPPSPSHPHTHPSPPTHSHSHYHPSPHTHSHPHHPPSPPSPSHPHYPTPSHPHSPPITPSTNSPPPKPPRAPNRLRLHFKRMEEQSRPSPSTTDALPSKTAYTPPSPPRSRAKTFGSARQVAAAFSSSSSSPSGPRTLRDFQQLSARSQRSKVKSPDEEDEEGTTLPVDELQRYLVAYVNQELSLSPSIPSRGKALYDVCSDTTNLCKLINKSVRNTVDLRALTIITPSMPIAEREEAIEENMTLTIESARAIGCRVTDSTGDLIIKKDPPTIRSFLVDLIRARVVHLPGMEDEPQTTFTNLSVLFSKLGISEGVDGEGEGGAENGEVEDKGRIQWREDGERLRQALKTPPKSPPSNRSWRDMEKPSSPTERTATSSSVGDTNLTYEERAALRRTEREEERLGEDTSTLTLTYEERAAMRRAERERKRRERAELAGSQ